MSEESYEPDALPESVAEKPVNKLFRYSAYIHVGEGAEECVPGQSGQCTDAGHFHAWVRMPNQFQHESLQQKGRAARARLQRALNDPETDACVILNEEMEELRTTTTSEVLVEALVGISDLQDRLEAMSELEATEEWEHRTDDVMRRRELEAMNEDERPQDELDQLIREGERYGEQVMARIEQIKAPRRSALGGLDMDGLIAQYREQRVTTQINAAFTDAYLRYQFYTCTLRPCVAGHPQDRVFKEPKDLDAASPEVVDALSTTFRDLELDMQRQLSGNW